MNNYLQTHRYLLQYSIKPSVQRTAVMDYLLKNRTHPTIDEIYSALSPSMPTLSKTTVYNTLNLFLEKGAVQQLVIDEKTHVTISTCHHTHISYVNSVVKYTILSIWNQSFSRNRRTQASAFRMLKSLIQVFAIVAKETKTHVNSDILKAHQTGCAFFRFYFISLNTDCSEKWNNTNFYWSS